MLSNIFIVSACHSDFLGFQGSQMNMVIHSTLGSRNNSRASILPPKGKSGGFLISLITPKIPRPAQTAGVTYFNKNL